MKFKKLCCIFVAFLSFQFTKADPMLISDFFTGLGLLTVPSNAPAAPVSPPPTSAPIGPTLVYPADMLPPIDQTMQLFMAITVSRHENRTIETTFSNDAYQGSNYWPEGIPDKITDAGKQAAFGLGRFVRNRYSSILGPDFSPSKVYIRSTDTSRTRISSQYLSAGVLSPLSKSYLDALNNQFVPIVTVPYSTDYILAQSMDCTVTDQQASNYLSSTQVQTQISSASALRTYVKNNSGTSINSPDAFFNIYDPLNIESMRGLTLPNWGANILNNYNYIMEYFLALSYQAYVLTPAMQKTKAGFLLREIFQNIKNTIANPASSTYRYYHYSGHQATLTNVLCALNVFKYDVPAFGSTIFFEVYQDGLSWYIQTLYRTDNSKYDLPLVIPGCPGPMCEINTFFQATSAVVASQTDTFDGLCQN